MKKVLLSLTLLVCSIIGLCQCPSTFNVINNGAGGCSNPFREMEFKPQTELTKEMVLYNLHLVFLLHHQ